MITIVTPQTLRRENKALREQQLRNQDPAVACALNDARSMVETLQLMLDDREKRIADLVGTLRLKVRHDLAS